MDKPGVKTYRRKNYFIEKSFQTNFILKFCGLVATGGVLTIGILYFLAMQSTTVSILNSRVVVKTTGDFILPVLIQTVAIVMIFVGMATIFITLFMSHKIAGPLYRFKKVIQNLREGDFTSNFNVRYSDQLQDLVNDLNNMITRLRVELNELKDNLKLLEEKLDNISEKDVSENKRGYLKEIKGIYIKLNKLIHNFKT